MRIQTLYNQRQICIGWLWYIPNKEERNCLCSFKGDYEIVVMVQALLFSNSNLQTSDGIK